VPEIMHSFCYIRKAGKLPYDLYKISVNKNYNKNLEGRLKKK
jgi:hypothetical protein